MSDGRSVTMTTHVPQLVCLAEPAEAATCVCDIGHHEYRYEARVLVGGSGNSVNSSRELLSESAASHTRPLTQHALRRGRPALEFSTLNSMMSFGTPVETRNARPGRDVLEAEVILRVR